MELAIFGFGIRHHTRGKLATLFHMPRRKPLQTVAQVVLAVPHGELGVVVGRSIGVWAGVYRSKERVMVGVKEGIQE